MAEFLLLFALTLVWAACQTHHLNQIKTLIQQERKANERGLTEVADALERLSLGSPSLGSRRSVLTWATV